MILRSQRKPSFPFITSFEVNELLAPGSWIDSATTLGAKGTLDLIALG